MTEDEVMITVQNHVQSATLPGISFDVSKLKGHFDPDVREQCDAALTSLKDSQRLYNIAVGAVRDRSLQKLNAEWAEIRPIGRKLEDNLNRKRQTFANSENSYRSLENTVRSATMGLNEVKATKLNKRPTVNEIAQLDAAIATATVAVREAKANLASNSARRQKLTNEVHILAGELTEYEAKERELAHKIKALSGQFPDRYIEPVEEAEKQRRTEATATLGGIRF